MHEHGQSGVGTLLMVPRRSQNAAAPTGGAESSPPVRRSTATARTISDGQLIHDFQQRGDDASFMMLIERYRNRIRRLLYTLLGGTDELADVEQEVVIALWRSLPRFRGHAAFATYLYRVCCNSAYSYLRRARRRAISFDEALHSDRGLRPASAAEALQTRTQRTALRRVLLRLKPSDRLLIHLREFERCSVAECAHVLRCSPHTIASKLCRAKQRLADILRTTHGDLEVQGL